MVARVFLLKHKSDHVIPPMASISFRIKNRVLTMAYMVLRDLPLSSQKKKKQKKKMLRARERQILDEIIYVPESRCVQS